MFGLEDSYINVTTLSYTVTGLEEYNNYSFVIAAATEKGLGPYSTAYNFTTDEDRECRCLDERCAVIVFCYI